MSRKTRKLIWSAPLVAVLAVAGALALFVALAPGSAQADHEDLLGSVTDLKAEVLGRAEIELSWKNPTGPVASYRIDTSDDTYVWESKEMSTTDVTTDADGVVTYTDTDELVVDASRYYRVFAMNSAGAGLSPLEDYVRADGIDPTAAGTTQDLVARADSSTQITLTWSMPEDDGHTPIMLYCISVSRPGTGFDPIDADNCAADDDVTTADTTPSITTINSNLVLGTPEAGTIVVGADGDTARQSYEHMGLTASTAYRYRVVAVNDEGPADTASNIASATTHGPGPGTTPTATDAVRNLRAVWVTNTVTLYWNLPADQNPTAADPIEYDVQSAEAARPPSDDDDWADVTLGDGSDDTVHEWEISSVQVPDTAGDKHHYRVRVSPNGSWSTFTLSPDVFDNTVLVPGPPERGTTASPLLPLASAGGSLTLITLTWEYVPEPTPTDAEPTGYQVDYVKGDSDPNTDTAKEHYRSVLPEERTGYGRSPLKHEPLEAGTEYVYRIFPYKDDVYGPPVEVTGMTAPAVAPDTRLTLRVSAEGPTKLKLTWNEPRTTGGSPVTGYYIQVSNDVDDNRTREGTIWFSIDDLMSGTEPDDGTQTAWEIDDTDTREYIYQGLMPEDARWFRVIALSAVATVALAGSDTLNGEAMDAIGSAVPVRGMTSRADVPMAPNGLVAEEARNSSLTGTNNRGVLLLWNAPEDPTGDELEGYVIARKVDDGAWDEEWKEIRESDPRTYLTDNDVPADDEVRYYRVAAFNSTGTGDFTDMVRYPSDGSHVPATGTMGEVSGVTATSDTDGEVTVMWMGGDNADRYFIIALERGSSPLVIGFERAESGASEATITGLNSDASHLVIVLALKGTGDDRELKYGTDTVTVQ